MHKDKVIKHSEHGRGKCCARAQRRGLGGEKSPGEMGFHLDYGPRRIFKNMKKRTLYKNFIPNMEKMPKTMTKRREVGRCA